MRLPEKIVGPETATIDAALEVWRFMSPIPPPPTPTPEALAASRRACGAPGDTDRLDEALHRLIEIVIVLAVVALDIC